METQKKVWFGFITKRPFWVNLLVAGALMFLIIFLFLQMLSWITNHGKFLKVPTVLGMKTTDAVKLLEKQGFEVSILDSTFTDTATRGTVLKQSPDPNATVKVNRTVLLTVNCVVPPLIDMPKLKDQSLHFALDLLARSHLQLEDTIFTENYKVGTVIDQLFHGVPIAEKTKIQWGSKITLVVAKGLGDELMPVPDLLGMHYADAVLLLKDKGIELASTVPVVEDGPITDTAAAYVVRQSPEKFNEDHIPVLIKAGQVMDLWISVRQY
ncbi:MAG TPA: PASTA domain-containing protein, partial [Ferruginibacter sp.]|nr:PASTA domain-containing protein [Ferruginibacter sp.]